MTFVPIVRVTWTAPISQDEVQEKLRKETIADPFLWNGGRWNDRGSVFVGRVEYDEFAITTRGIVGNAFSPQARGKISRVNGEASKIRVTVMPNGIALAFWIAVSAFLLFATGFVTVRAFQLHISASGALVPLSLLLTSYGGGTALFRSAATDLVGRLRQMLGDNDLSMRA